MRRADRSRACVRAEGGRVVIRAPIAIAWGIGFAVGGVALLTASVSTGHGLMAWVGSGLFLGVLMLIGNTLTEATKSQPRLRWTLASVLFAAGFVVAFVVVPLLPASIGDSVGAVIVFGFAWMLGSAANELPLWRPIARPTGFRDPAPHGTGKCHHCGYDLTASRDAIQCPECGTVVPNYGTQLKQSAASSAPRPHEL